MTLKQFLDKMHHNYIPIHIFEWDSERGKRNGTRWDVPENNYDFSHIPDKIIDGEIIGFTLLLDRITMDVEPARPVQIVCEYNMTIYGGRK